MPNVMAAQPNTGGAVCKSSVIPFLVPHHKVWLTAAAPLPCSKAANIGERNTWTQSKFCTWQNHWHHRTYKLGVKIRKCCSLNCLWRLSRPIEKQRCLYMCAVYTYCGRTQEWQHLHLSYPQHSTAATGIRIRPFTGLSAACGGWVRARVALWSSEH